MKHDREGKDMALLIPMDWDSEQLGLSCRRLECSSALPLQRDTLIAHIAAALASDPSADLVAAKIPTSINLPQTLKQVLPTWRVRHLGVEVVHLRVASLPDSKDNGDVIFYPGTADPSPFLALAWDMHFSRYHLDPKIGIERAVSLWKNSITDHCRGFAQETAVISLSGLPAGIATVHMDKTNVRLHIVGVLNWARGQGVGKRLLQGVIARYGRTHDIMVEAHEENIAATALYASAGCHPVARSDILHFWNTTR
jgi:ribosomal protein S18 acetylase RimI-like enzyme